jgi:trimeric autotransporter adhesin
MTSGHSNSTLKKALAGILIWCGLTAAAAASPYSVKVTVTGLAAPAVLDNNGQDRLTVPANGTFAFTTRLAPGQAYNVAVRTAPSFPAQSCLLTGASGVIGNADVVVGLTCKNLGIPRLVAAADVHRATVTWNLPSDALSHDLFVSSVPNCDTRNYASCPNGTLFTNVTSPYAVIGLPNDQPRYFVLESRYKNGTRGLSNEAGARPSGVAFGGFVHALTAHQNSVFVGGAFTAAGISSGSAVPFERDTGQPVSPTFPIVSGHVFAIESDLQHGYYIGGDFTAVGGVPRANFAHILADGSVDASFNPAPNGIVKALAYVKGRLYIGGNFTIIGGQSRTGLAALGAGGVLTSWSPMIGSADPVRAIAGSNDRIFVGGAFSTVNGQSRLRLAAFNAVNAADRPGELLPWIADANSDVNALEIANGKLFVGGTFTTVAGQARNQLAAFHLDAAANPTGLALLNKASPGSVSVLAASGNTLYVGQSDLVALDAGTGAVVRRLSTNGGGVVALLLFAEKLYVGGSFRTLDGVPRLNLASVDAATNVVSTWNPSPNSAVFALAGFNRTVYAGGTFTGINSVRRDRLAQLDGNGALTSWNPSASSHVLAIAVSPSGQTIYVGGYFGTINGEAHANLAAIDATGAAIASFNHPSTSQPIHTPSPFRHPREDRVNAVVLSGSKVFAGGRFAKGLAAYHAVEAPVSAGVRIPWTAQIGWVETLAVGGDQRLYAGGSFTTADGQPRLRLAAYALDAASHPGALSIWDPSADATVYASTILGGTIYIGGDFLTAHGVPHHHLAAFDSTALPMGWQPHANGSVFAMTKVGNTILAAGDFTVAASSARPYIASIRTNGTLNPGFNANADGGVFELAATPNGAIYVAGAFSSIGGKLRGGFARLNAAGSAD